MLRGILSKIIIGFVLLVLVSCEPSPNKKISGTMDNSGVQFPITVHTFQTQREYDKAVKDIKTHNEPSLGYSRWWLSKTTNEMTRCEIYVVVPNAVDDDHMDTWGHELAHCIYGRYHREPVGAKVK